MGTVIAQISDPHIPAAGAPAPHGTTARTNLEAAIRDAGSHAAAILLTGDIAAKTGSDDEYAEVAEAVAQSAVRILPCSGNHDDPYRLAALFGMPMRGDRLDYAITVGNVHIIVLDSSRLGMVAGTLDDEQLEWLDGQLAAHPNALVALHHPSVDIGDAMFDQIRLDDLAAARLADVCERRHPVAVLHGHAHQAHRSTIGGAPLFVCPSSAYGFDSVGPRLVPVPHAPRYALHRIAGGSIVTDVVNAPA
jgi:3',5'-cyclic AMP phosphodiesterase CpdA